MRLSAAIALLLALIPWLTSIYMPLPMYCKYRNWILAIVKLTIGLLPHYHTSDVIPNRLRYAPQSQEMGVFGYVIDIFRMVVGSRTMVLFFGALMAPLPLGLLISSQFIVIRMLASSTSALCKAQLFVAYSSGIDSLNILLYHATAPITLIIERLMGTSCFPTTHVARCTAVIAWVNMLFGLVLPAFIFLMFPPIIVRKSVQIWKRRLGFDHPQSIVNYNHWEWRVSSTVVLWWTLVTLCWVLSACSGTVSNAAN